MRMAGRQVFAPFTVVRNHISEKLESAICHPTCATVTFTVTLGTHADSCQDAYMRENVFNHSV